MRHSSSPRYRADIDGLRAIAVLAVVVFHGFPRVIQGGFIGVDVFFVISGFLITSIIVGGLDQHSFSFGEFYANRMRRIFPALIVVLVACLAVGWFVLLPDEYRQLGKHVAAGAGFLSNFVFWQEANYFDAAADTKILLPLWSLGVEEQYYLLWPVLVWAAWKHRLNLLTLCVVILLISFCNNVQTVGLNATAAFYSPLSRFWELLCGGLLAYLSDLQPTGFVRTRAAMASWTRQIVFHPGQGNPATILRDFASILGAALLLYAMFAISPQKPFPGWWSLLPIAAACLIISAGPQAWFNRIVLSSRILVWFGLISYPLYLWHWPLFAFARNILGHMPPPEIRGVLLLAGIALAWLTYRLIEIPIRFGRRKPAIVYALCAVLASVGGFGYFDYLKDGMGFRFRDRDDYSAYFEGFLREGTEQAEELKKITQNQCNFFNYLSSWPTQVPRAAISPECYTKHTAKSVLLWGDSHAADLYPGLSETLPKNISLLLIFSSGCRVAPIEESDVDLKHCAKSNAFALSVISKSPPDIVILSSSSSFQIDQIRQIAQQLKREGVRKVIVLGPAPYWQPALYKIIIKDYWYFTPRRIPGHQNPAIEAVAAQFKSSITATDDFRYVDLRDFFCNAEGCLTYLGDDRRQGLLVFDESHLRPPGSLYLAKKLLAPLILQEISK